MSVGMVGARRDYVATFSAEATVVFAYLLTFHLVASQAGGEAFGEYSLARRSLSLLAPIGLVGIDIAAARFIAVASVKTRGDGGYVLGTAVVMLVATGLLSLSLLVFASPLAFVLFGSARYANLVAFLPAMLLGNGLYVFVYGVLRGAGRMLQASILLAVGNGLIPLAAVLISRQSVPGMLSLAALGWAVVALLFLPLARLDVRWTLKRVPTLVVFGLPRVPGDFLQLALFTVPGILVAHVADLKTAGVVAFVIAALRLSGSVLSPIGNVLLPAAARRIAAGDGQQLRGALETLTRMTAILVSVAIVAVEIGADGIVRIYLGPGFESGVPLLRLIVLAALPWSLFVILRTVIDAHYFSAINARNLATSSAVYALGAGIAWITVRTALTLTAPLVLSLYVLGGLTLIETRRINRDLEAGQVLALRDPAVLADLD